MQNTLKNINSFLVFEYHLHEMFAINSLRLTNFKLHLNLEIEMESKDVVFIGSNGSGKTTILESLSVFAPGKHGMIGIQPHELITNGVLNDESILNKSINVGIKTSNGFSISYKCNINESSKASKCFYVNDKKLPSLSQIYNWIDVLWMTPSLAHDISKDNSARRKIFDRWCFHLNHKHSENINKCDKLLKYRLENITSGKPDESFLNLTELEIAKYINKITKERISLCNKIKEQFSDKELRLSFFETSIEYATLAKNGPERLEYIKEQLKLARNKDAIRYSSTFSHNKTKIQIFSMDHNNKIELLSNGQKQLTVLKLLECIAKIITNAKNQNPIILIDEISSIMDSNNIDLIIESFRKNDCQHFLTSIYNIKTSHNLKSFNL